MLHNICMYAAIACVYNRFADYNQQPRQHERLNDQKCSMVHILLCRVYESLYTQEDQARPRQTNAYLKVDIPLHFLLRETQDTSYYLPNIANNSS